MSKLSKVIIFIFLFLAAGAAVFAVSHISEAESEEKSTVYVCPNAASISEINPRCPDKIILKEGETTQGLTLTTTYYEDKEYYLVSGLENGGGGVNLPPIADARGPYLGYAGLPITIDASSSTDPNNDPLQYRWDFNSDNNWDTDWLTTSTTEHIWNNDYEGMIILEASDGEFSSLATSQVKIKSARTFKREAISELNVAKTGDKKNIKKIDKIIWFIDQSLNENLWTGASHLIFFEKDFENLNENKFEEMFEGEEWTGPKIGIVVFHYEKVAVRLMMNEIKSKKTSNELKQVFEEVINKLVRADQLLAKVSLFDAKNTTIQNPKFQKIVEYQIKKAEEELSKAEKELEKGKPDKAISRLAKSWLHYELAIRFANFSIKL